MYGASNYKTILYLEQQKAKTAQEVEIFSCCTMLLRSWLPVPRRTVLRRGLQLDQRVGVLDAVARIIEMQHLQVIAGHSA